MRTALVKMSPGGIAEIREFASFPSGELTHALVPALTPARPARLEGLDEYFYVLQGEGLLWRRSATSEEIVSLRRGRCVSIPRGIDFQYRATAVPPEMLVMVTPRWRRDMYRESDESFWDAAGDELRRQPRVSRIDWERQDMPLYPDYSAPDGSEIRVLLDSSAGGLCGCSLGHKQISAPVYHRTVDEIWYVVDGEGEVWRSAEGREEVIAASVGTALTLPRGVSFQFRSTGATRFTIVVATFPRWPGPDEAVRASAGMWHTNVA
jgi:mannose-6-phosphate isomerase-like protein (cupin superfamily)